MLTSGLTRCLIELALASNAPAVLKSQVSPSHKGFFSRMRFDTNDHSLSMHSPTSSDFRHRTKKPLQASLSRRSFLLSHQALHTPMRATTQQHQTMSLMRAGIANMKLARDGGGVERQFLRLWRRCHLLSRVMGRRAEKVFE